jgi:Ala-tRNA(Pro) deacylase
MEDVYKTLENLNISYKRYNHPPVYTTREAEKYTKNIQGVDTKNLFLKDKKGKRYYLVILPAEERADLKKLAEKVKEKKLSFASSEKLMKYLGLEAGSVSLFGLINDKKSEVKVLVHKNLLKAEKLGFHPNKNTATIVISQDSFRMFLSQKGNEVFYFS